MRFRNLNCYFKVFTFLFLFNKQPLNGDIAPVSTKSLDLEFRSGKILQLGVADTPLKPNSRETDSLGCHVFQPLSTAQTAQVSAGSFKTVKWVY